MSLDTTQVDVAICTYRRMGVAATLASLAKLALPFNTTIRIIVADNDREPSAQVTVAQAAAEHGLNVTYLHAPAQNISIARNACLDAATGDFLAFVDDDEIVSPEWLAELLTRQRDTLAPIVLGPVRAVYRSDYPAWVVLGDFHSTKPTVTNGAITTGYAGNVLMTRDAFTNQRFREDLGVSGGEDTEFFARLARAGARIAYAENAVAFEAVPPERATLRWLLKRRYRFGQTHALMLREAGAPLQKNKIKAYAKAFYCYAIACVCILFPLKRRQWLLRGTLHLGVARTLGAAP